MVMNRYHGVDLFGELDADKRMVEIVQVLGPPSSSKAP